MIIVFDFTGDDSHYYGKLLLRRAFSLSTKARQAEAVTK